MNSEEKIISMLIDLTAKVSDLNHEFTQRLDNLESGQATLSEMVDRLEAKSMRLEAGQVKLEVGLAKFETGQAAMQVDIADIKAGQASIAKDVKDIREQTEDLVEFEAEMRLNFKTLKGVSKVNTYDIAELKAAVNL